MPKENIDIQIDEMDRILEKVSQKSIGSRGSAPRSFSKTCKEDFYKRCNTKRFSRPGHTLETDEVVSAVKNRVYFPNKILENRVIRKVEGLMNVKNLLATYVLSKVFNLPVITEKSLKFIELFFTTLVETRNFLELDCASALEILASSELQITSELEVYNSGNAWLRYKEHDRKEHAKQLLLAVRLNLLKDHALKYILEESSSFTENEDCVSLISEALENVERCNEHQVSLSNSHRYCHHRNFNFFICGHLEVDKNENCILKTVDVVDSSTLKPLKKLAGIKQRRKNFNAVCLKDEVYVIGGESKYGDKRILLRSVDRYSFQTGRWEKVTDVVDERYRYCASAFMHKIFLLGGKICGQPCADSCLEYDTKKRAWKTCAGMNERRFWTASAVFEERIVVCGGYGVGNNPLTTVESYDVIADKWSPMPSMVKTKFHHKMVVVKSKLHVIDRGFSKSEVYDSVSKKFVSLKSPFYIGCVNEAFAIGCKIFVFQKFKNEVNCFDVDKNEWSVDYFRYGDTDCSCLKIPWL